jgi:hypothetical protein
VWDSMVSDVCMESSFQRGAAYRRLRLLPLPLAGEGWGGGSRGESVP